MTGNVNLPDIQRGDTVPYLIRWTDSGVKIDMRGKTVVMSFKVSSFQEDEDADLIKTVLVPLDATEEDKNVVSYQLESNETKLLKAGITYDYAVRVQTPASPEVNELTHFFGQVLVKDA